jgi:hypothetical protein
MAKTKEEKERKRQEKLLRQKRVFRQRLLKKIAGGAILLLLLGGGIWGGLRYVKHQPDVAEEEIISRNGLHWHPHLTITIKGEEQEIPANIGIGVIEAPIHTHDATGTIHMEMTGLVTKDDTKLGKFFAIWGKQFNANCIFEFCNGADGKVKMFVNGTENTDFDQYPMKDGDKIEIRYE